MNLHRSTLLMIAVCLVCLAVSTTVSAQDVTVEVSCDVDELTAAVSAANGTGANETLNLAPNCIYTFTKPYVVDGFNAIPGIANAGTITINGNGATIERSFAQSTPAFRLIHVNGTANLTLNNVTVRNGQMDTGLSNYIFGGGGIRNYGNLVINNSALLDSEVTGFSGDGGAIANERGNVTIKDSVISGNNAVTNSGGGGGIYSNGGQVTIRRSSIGFNGHDGILVQGATRLIVTNSTIHNNTLSGIASLSASDQVTVINSTIVNNNAHGVFFDMAEINIFNSIMVDNLINDCMNRYNRGNISGNNNIIDRIDDCYALTDTIGSNPLLDGYRTAANGTTYYPLHNNSPAIDAGNPTTVTEAGLLHDQLGNNRVSGSAVDIGAFEFRSLPERSDVNNDGIISPADAIYVINRLGSTTNPEADVDGDGTVTQADLQAVGNALGTTLAP